MAVFSVPPKLRSFFGNVIVLIAIGVQISEASTQSGFFTGSIRYATSKKREFVGFKHIVMSQNHHRRNRPIGVNLMIAIEYQPRIRSIAVFILTPNHPKHTYTQEENKGLNEVVGSDHVLGL